MAIADATPSPGRDRLPGSSDGERQHLRGRGFETALANAEGAVDGRMAGAALEGVGAMSGVRGVERGVSLVGYPL